MNGPQLVKGPTLLAVEWKVTRLDLTASAPTADRKPRTNDQRSNDIGLTASDGGQTGKADVQLCPLLCMPTPCLGKQRLKLIGLIHHGGIV
jgi:hypothetical protein